MKRSEPFSRCFRWAASAILIAFVSTAASSQQLATVYHAVLDPQLARAGAVENLTLDLHGLHFELAAGSVALGTPVRGHVTVAAFQGSGTLRVSAPTQIEREQLLRFGKQDPLTVTFNAAIFRFADAAEFLAAIGDDVRFNRAPAAALQALVSERDHDQESLARPDGVRLLQAMALPPALPQAAQLLLADLRIGSSTWVEADYDSLQAEPVRVHAPAQRDLIQRYGDNFVVRADATYVGPPPPTIHQGFDDTWLQFAPTGIPAEKPLWRAEGYDLAARFGAGMDPRNAYPLAIMASMDVRSLVAGVRGMWMELDGTLRVTSVKVDSMAAQWLQAPPAYTAALLTQGWGNWLYIELPKPLAQGQDARVALKYQTLPLPQMGYHGVSGTAPTISGMMASDRSWYPRPPDETGVAWTRFQVQLPGNSSFGGFGPLGSRPGLATLGDSGTLLPALGFALDYTYGERTSEIVGIQLHTLLSGLPALTAEAKAALQFLIGRLGAFPFPRLSILGMPNTISASIIAADRVDPNLDTNISTRAADIPGILGVMPTRDYENWPGLICFNVNLIPPPYFGSGIPLNAAVVAPYTLPTLRSDSIFLLPHEIAHQWWGNTVGWQSYHDRWLAEGLADISALLFDEARYGTADSRAIVENWQHELLRKDGYGAVPNDDGPLWLGQRLTSSLDPYGDEIVVYDKSGYVVYMLAQMMRDSAAKDPDARFWAMLEAFRTTYDHRAPSTADFEAIAEKYMTPEMDLDHNGKLDWFFNEYVYGTSVPSLAVAWKVSAGPNGTSRIALHVDNPEGWRGLLPIYSYRDDDHYVRGKVAVNGKDVDIAFDLPFVPERVEADRFLDMLIQLKQSPTKALTSG